MKECSKSISRRLAAPNFATRYFRGKGIDIGGAPDPLAIYSTLFPLIADLRTWDRADGDAQYMAQVADEAYDFVHSSHCLEHMQDPGLAMRHWFRILRPGGHLIITVPDEDLYEQGIFPSTFNRDHKWTFTICKRESWSARSLNILDLVRDLGAAADVKKIEVIDAAYRYELPRYDQTLTPVSESCIEMVIRKRPPEEIEFRGLPPRGTQPDRERRIHLNQYRDDLAALKRSNESGPPFCNEGGL